MSKIKNCAGCKWLEPGYSSPRYRPEPGTGHCEHFLKSRAYKKMQAALSEDDLEYISPEYRRPDNKRCELYEPLNAKPKTEYAPVIHAKWEISCDGYYPYCSHCKTEPPRSVSSDIDRQLSKYCPECGAKMDGNGDDNNAQIR